MTFRRTVRSPLPPPVSGQDGRTAAVCGRCQVAAAAPGVRSGRQDSCCLRPVSGRRCRPRCQVRTAGQLLSAAGVRSPVPPLVSGQDGRTAAVCGRCQVAVAAPGVRSGRQDSCCLRPVSGRRCRPRCQVRTAGQQLSAAGVRSPLPPPVSGQDGRTAAVCGRCQVAVAAPGVRSGRQDSCCLRPVSGRQCRHRCQVRTAGQLLSAAGVRSPLPPPVSAINGSPARADRADRADRH